MATWCFVFYWNQVYDWL